ncbi:hypothetical protein [Caproicibacterium lactatifermentans]|uniref:hypothetical protein n=1 Tax=Caproicibacterium lactatifermentans TaxID=2666138 RepID=UPI003084096B
MKLENSLQNMSVHHVPQLFDELVPVVVRVVDKAMEHLALTKVHITRIELINHVQKFWDVFIGIFSQITQSFFNTKLLKLFFQTCICHIDILLIKKK